MVSELTDAPINELRTKALVREQVRVAVAGMLARQEASFDEEESIGYLRDLERKQNCVKDALRRRNWAFAAELGSSTAPIAGVQLEDLKHPVVARELLAQTRYLIDLALQVERDGEDPLRMASAEMLKVGLKPERSALTPAMQMSAAIEKASEEAPVDVEKKIRAVGKLAIAFFGDVPVAMLTQDRVFEFIEFVWNMPKNWGQLHGKNRFEQVGSGLDPIQIKREADEDDSALLKDVLADTTATKPEKRFRLVQELRPRLTDGYLFVQRDMFNRIVKAALGSKATGRDLDDEARIVPSHKQIKSRLNKWHKAAKTECGLPKRVSRPKRRRSWSIEHLVKLFLSPLYAGSSSLKQRWRKPTAAKRTVVRDALYWVPLFMIALGVRPEEILQLKVKNVRRRDGVICLFFGDDLDESLKADQSRRVLPVPQLLLDLGFLEWVAAKCQTGQTWAFPDVEPSESDGRRSQTFGNRMRTYLAKVKLKFSDEDIYAMRRTLASKLLALKVDTGVRQRILGHLEGTTVDRHYSDDGLPALKEILDQVDYGIHVGEVPKVNFPIITGCAAPILPPLDVLTWMNDEAELCAIHLTDPDTDETILAARLEGVELLKEDDARQFPVLTGSELATKILELQGAYSLTLPACDATVAAIEHMLILAKPFEEAVQQCPQKAKLDTMGSDANPLSAAYDAAPTGSEQSSETDRRTGQFEIGDTANCIFPAKRQGKTDRKPTPGLVVGVKTMHGRRYLDIAEGRSTQAGEVIAPYQLVIGDPSSLTAAGIKLPVRFDLRRRVLIAETDTRHICGPVGTLADSLRMRLSEAKTCAGDISPQPVS